MIWITVIGGVLLLFCFIVLTPVIIEIDSNRERYSLLITGIAHMNLVFNEDGLLLNLKALWWKKSINPFDISTVKTKERKVPKRKKSHMPVNKMIKKMKNVFNSFTVKYFFLDIDTGNFLWNAWLFPLVYPLSKGNVRINYNGRVILRLKMVNNIARLIIAIIK